jgi:hypothetical protein
VDAEAKKDGHRESAAVMVSERERPGCGDGGIGEDWRDDGDDGLANISRSSRSSSVTAGVVLGCGVVKWENGAPL